MEISFKRAIKINSDTNPMGNFKDSKFDPSSAEIINATRGKRSSIYDKDTSRKIGSFMRAQLGYYNNNEDIYTKRIQGDLYLFTGPEAIKARQIEDEARKERTALEEEYEKGADSSMPMSEQVELSSRALYKINRQNIYIRRDKKLLDLTENGEKGRPLSSFNFESDKSGRINKIQYNYFYSDGDTFIDEEKTLNI